MFYWWAVFFSKISCVRAFWFRLWTISSSLYNTNCIFFINWWYHIDSLYFIFHISVTFYYFLRNVFLLHFMQLFINSLFMFNLYNHFLFFQVILFFLLLSHLLHQLVSILSLLPFSFFKFFFCDFFEIISRFHVKSFLSCLNSLILICLNRFQIFIHSLIYSKFRTFWFCIIAVYIIFLLKLFLIWRYVFFIWKFKISYSLLWI